jgi:hydroxymethylpyrimidine pyrophosphatase-like HAD family hydrolase
MVERQLGNVGESAVLLNETQIVPSPMKIMIIDKREKTSLRRLADDFANTATVSLSHRHLLEVGPKNVDKGTGLKSVVARLSDTNVTIHAVGDAENDIPLLAAAKHRYTVKNGLNELKKMSEFVGRSCDEGGLADVIEYIVAHNI